MAASMAPAGEAASGPLLSAVNPSDIHVLLVDDERLTRLVVGNLLRTCKYKVTIAESGKQALEVLSKAGPGAFQLILTDVMMPDVGGLELLRFVRSHQHLYNVPVIMMSASEAQETMCAALLGSADEYLVKPVTRKEVQNIWMHVMKRYHHAAAVQPAAVLEDPTAPATAAPLRPPPPPPPPQQQQQQVEAEAATGAAPGGRGAALIHPGIAAGLGPASCGSPAPAAPGGSGLQLARDVPLLSLGMDLGGSLGLPPEVARDMMRAAALAASTTAAGRTEAAVLPGGARQLQRAALRLPGPMAGEKGQAQVVQLREVGGPTADSGLHAGGAAALPGCAPAEGPGSEAAAAVAAAVVAATALSPATAAQLPSVHPHNAQQPHAAAGVAGGGGGGCGGGHGASKVNLLKWLRRSTRCIQPKESFWIFCEVLLLLDSFQAAAGGWRACGLRPSKLMLYSNGRVAFAPPQSPLLPPPSAAAAAATGGSTGAVKCNGGGGGCGRSEGSGGGGERRKRRRRRSAGQPRGAEEDRPASVTASYGRDGCGGAVAGGELQAGQGQAPPGVAAATAAVNRSLTPPPPAAATLPLNGLAAVSAPAGLAIAAAGTVDAAVRPLLPVPVSPAAAATATATGSSGDDEDALYCSPEEALGHPATPASDMFSLGLLFFDLFYVCTGRERAALLRDARQRLLPPSFLRQQPKEAAFALALLHPDPSCRPTLRELLGSAMFRATCASLRQKAQKRPAGAAAATAGACVDSNGREQPQRQVHAHDRHYHHHHSNHNHDRQTNHNRQPAAQVHHRAAAAAAGGAGGGGGGGGSARAAAGSGANQQLLHPQHHPVHRLAAGSVVATEGRAAGAQVTSGAVAAAAAAALHASSGAAAAAGPSGSAALRVDNAVLSEFLHMLRKRKLEELSQVDAELSLLSSDAQLVEHYLMYLHQTRSVKRQRGPGSGGNGGAAAAAANTAPPANPVAGGGSGSGSGSGTAPSTMPPPPPPAPHAQVPQQPAAPDGEAGEAVPGGMDAAGGGEEGPRQAAAAAAAAAASAATAAAATVLTLPHSAAWCVQHQAAQSKWCRIAQKYEQLEGVFFERCRTPPASVSLEQPSAQAGSLRNGGGPTAAAAAAAAAAARRHADAGGLPEPLLRFAEDLAAFATFTTLTPVASLRYGDPPTSSSMVAGAAFDRDDEFFAVAGVSKRIKIYEREAVLRSHIGAHYPVLEISSRSRLSSVTWSGYIKGHLASADYEGVVQLWDANTNSELMQFEEHRKRVWSIDFSQADPARLLSGGDDGLIKLWSIQQETSTTTIDLRANVCSVQFSPTSPHLLAAGCANYRIFLYDIRNTSRALHILPGHTRAVSYVRFLSPTQLVSASTDNTLRLWQLDRLGAGVPAASAAPGPVDAAAGSCVQVFRGHANERNFTGLSVSADGYISCGSENNRVFCYYQSLPMPVTSYDFSSPDAASVGIGCVGSACGGGGGGNDRGGGGGGVDGAMAALAAAGGVGSAAAVLGAAAGTDSGGLGAPGNGGSASGSGQFVSSVCWSRRSNLLLAANSVGLIKLFTLH